MYVCSDNNRKNEEKFYTTARKGLYENEAIIKLVRDNIYIFHQIVNTQKDNLSTAYTTKQNTPLKKPVDFNVQYFEDYIKNLLPKIFYTFKDIPHDEILYLFDSITKNTEFSSIMPTILKLIINHLLWEKLKNNTSLKIMDLASKGQNFV
jgi:hypothetical protein